jgi:hypothetical protein
MVSYTHKRVLSEAVEQFSDLVHKHKLIKGDGDEEALMSAVQSVARNMASEDDKENDIRGISPSRFLESTYSRLENHSKKVQNWVEDQKKLKTSIELANMKEKPSINSTSRQFSKNVPPIYKRVDAILKQKRERLASLQKETQARTEEFSSTQTARNPNEPRRHRSLKEITTSLYTWDRKKQINNQKRLFEKNQSEKAEIKSKPDISPRSRKLASKRNSSPVYERLFVKKPAIPDQISPSFKPAVNPASEKMLQKSPHKRVFERLYEARNTTPKSPRPVPPPRSPIRSSSPVHLALNEVRRDSTFKFIQRDLIDLCLSRSRSPQKQQYKVLTSKGVILDEPYTNTNEISFTDDQTFLNDLIKFSSGY